MKRVVLLLAMLALALAAASVAAPRAWACDPSYWNISCEYYSPGEQHTAFAFCCTVHERVNATFEPFDTTLVILTTGGGSIISQNTMGYNGITYMSAEDGQKVGCKNHHTQTQWVNCRHMDGW